jgi:hypothetical protein
MQRVYELMGASVNVENAHFADEQHDYGPSKRRAMYRFLAKHLKLDGNSVDVEGEEVDESFVTVLKREDLLVFTPEHPRPAHELADAEQIIGLLDR